MSERSTVYTIIPTLDSTLAIETRTSGWAKRKHLFVFERFEGTLLYDPDHPLDSSLSLTIEAASLGWRGQSKPDKSTLHLEDSLRAAFGSSEHPEFHLESQRLIAKPLRGFILEGTLHFRDREHSVKANLGFGEERKYRLQIDLDAALQLSDFGIARPSSLLGLIRTENEVVLHAYLWGTRVTAANLAAHPPS